jgi:predicted ATPase/class 3 adenylate cyclase
VDIAAWLRELGLERYEQAFRDNDVDAKVLPYLTVGDLKDIGITSVGHRRSLLAAIEALRAESVTPESDEPSAAAPAAAEPSCEAERRQLTVMFVDLVGSTALAERLDPEDMREVIRGYQNTVVGEIGRFEGHVAKFMGDGVLAYFGYPRAHEDEAERAVRAGLAIASAVARLETADAPLGCRVGIATGLVVVGDLIGAGAAQEQAVVGETPNLAARLQALAEPGDVVIAARTRRLLGELFEIDPLSPAAVKGFSKPVQAFRVGAERPAEGRFEARHPDLVAPLVGRDQELALILDRWALARAGEGQVVLLGGEPGIGKSRIVLALRERLRAEPRISLRYQCSPYHANVPLWPVIGHLERAAGFSREDAPEVRVEKLLALLRRASAEADATLPLICDLFGLPTGGALEGLTPQAKKARTHEALIGQIEGLAAQSPLLLVLEDAHWLDPTTQELFEQLVQRLNRMRALLVATYRPEWWPPWYGYSHVTSLGLSRLARHQVTAIIDRVSAGVALPDEVLEQIVERTDGVPLFVEELTKTVLESGLLRRGADRYEIAGPLPPLAVPASLHDSLTARLDRLAPIKEVAQIGAVIGREFSFALLAAVADRSEGQLDQALDQLVAAELLHRRGALPDAIYTFKHALVRDTAYAGLLRARRQQTHARVASVLEERFPETPPELLAHHLTEAGLDERAAEAWARAGLAALGRSAMREAATSLSQAVDLLRRMPATPEHQRSELELLAGLGVALTNTRGPASPEARGVHERAGELARALGDREGWFRARWNLWRVHNVRGEFDQAVALGEALLREAEVEGDVAHEVQARHALWSSHLFMGDLETTCSHVDRMLPIYDIDRHGRQALVFGGHDVRECGLSAGSTALFLWGYPEQALARNAQGLAHAQTLGQPQVVAHAHNWGSILLQLAGQFDELARRTDALRCLADEHGLAIYYPEARFLATWLAARQERDRRKAEELRAFLDRRAAMGTVYLQPYFLMMLADAWLHLGEPVAASAAVEDALARAEAGGEHLCTAELHRLSARAALACDRRARADAEATLRMALRTARQRSSRIFEVRAACDLARLWAEQGEPQKAHDLLAPVYGWFTEGFDIVDLKQAKALLDELS